MFVRKAGKWISNSICIAAGIIIVAALAMAVLQIKPAIVMSGSMEPTIHTGSVVFIDTKDKNVEKGDIVAFQRGDIFVTHRIAGFCEEGYLTKGDANDSVDPGAVSREQIVGKSLASLPKAGFLLHALQTPWMAAAILGVLALMFLCREKRNSA